MKKKIIIPIVIVVAVILVWFLPIPRGTYDDGGTRVYDALAYKIVAWNRITASVDENGQTAHGTYRNTSVYWYPDNLRSIGELWEMEFTYDLENTVSRVGYIEGYEIWLGALNKEKLYINSVQHLPIFKFDTLSEFEGFKRAVGEENIDIGYGESPTLDENTAKYDAKFFEDNSLVLVYVGANSGSYRYDVNRVFCNEGALCVHIEQTNSPKIVTDDMAGWFITVAVSDALIENVTMFDADLDN